MITRDDNAQLLSLTNGSLVRNNASMSKMRKILSKLMESAGHTAYDIHQKAGVQPSTIYRYFASERSDLKPATAIKIARLYGITESQLRGDVPIEGLEIPPEKHELKELLPLDEYKFVSNVKRMDERTRDILYNLAEMLVAEPQAAYQSVSTDRRKNDIYPNAQLRAGETRHKSNPTHRRRKAPFDARHYRAINKSTQSA